MMWGEVDVVANGPQTASVSAATKGAWELLPCDSQILAVHAALLHTGKILFFAGSGNDER